MTIAELIMAARKRKKWSQQKLANAVGVSRESVSQWEKGESAPKRSRQPIVAKVLEIPVTSFGPLSASGISLVDATEQNVVNLPLYNLSAITMRTNGQLRKELSDGSIAASRNFSEQCFAAEVADEAMAPLFQMGDHLIVDEAAKPRDRDVVVAGVPGKVLMLRQYQALGQNSRGQEVFELRSTNPDFPTIPMDSLKGLRVVGVVMEHRRKLRRD